MPVRSLHYKDYKWMVRCTGEKIAEFPKIAYQVRCRKGTTRAEWVNTR